MRLKIPDLEALVAGIRVFGFGAHLLYNFGFLSLGNTPSMAKVEVASGIFTWLLKWLERASFRLFSERLQGPTYPKPQVLNTIGLKL